MTRFTMRVANRTLKKGAFAFPTACARTSRVRSPRTKRPIAGRRRVLRALKSPIKENHMERPHTASRMEPVPGALSTCPPTFGPITEGVSIAAQALFLAEYIPQLEADMRKQPDVYAFPIEEAGEVALRMVTAL